MILFYPFPGMMVDMAALMHDQDQCRIQFMDWLSCLKWLEPVFYVPVLCPSKRSASHLKYIIEKQDNL